MKEFIIKYTSQNDPHTTRFQTQMTNDTTTFVAIEVIRELWAKENPKLTLLSIYERVYSPADPEILIRR